MKNEGNGKYDEKMLQNVIKFESAPDLNVSIDHCMSRALFTHQWSWKHLAKRLILNEILSQTIIWIYYSIKIGGYEKYDKNSNLGDA